MATLYYNGNSMQQMNVPDSEVSYWVKKNWKTSSNYSSGSEYSSVQPSSSSQGASNSGVTLSSLLTDSQISGDAKMKSWLNGNATLIPKLASLGYSAEDIKNEAYAWTRFNHSAFSGDMTTTSRSQNSGFGQSSNNLSSATDNTPAKKGTIQNSSLVKFPDSSTVYLVDSNDKILVPFTSQGQFEEYFGENVDDAWNSIAPIEHTDPRITDYELSTETFGADWSLPSVDKTAKTIANRYGQANNEDTNIKAYSVLDSFLGLLKSDPSNAGIDVMTIDNILNDKTQLAKYLSALAYGGYSLEDVFRDVKIQQMKTNGDTSIGDSEAISFEKNKNAYSSSDTYKALSSNSNLQMPATIKGITDTGLLDLNIFQMPEELYKELVPIFDPTSEEGKQLVDSIKTQYYDQMEMQINAETEQEKAQADASYKDWADTVNKTYGIQLSLNIDQARSQIDQLSAAQGNSGLSGTGMGLEQQVKYLKQMQKSIQINRINNLTSKDQKDAQFYQATASPEEIAALVAKDQASGLPRDQWKSVIYGLVPSTEMLNSLSIEALKAKYPDADEKSLEYMRSSILDANGNYYSTLYGNRAKNLYGDATTGSKGLYSEKKLFQENQASAQASEAEKKAYQGAGLDVAADEMDLGKSTGTTDFGADARKRAAELAKEASSLTSESTTSVAPNANEPKYPDTQTSSTSTKYGTNDLVTYTNPTTGKTKKGYYSANASMANAGYTKIS